MSRGAGSLSVDDEVTGAIMAFVRAVAAAGAEVSADESDGDARTRSALAELIDEWSERLMFLTGRRVVAPDLYPYVEEELELISASDIRRRMATATKDNVQPPKPLVGVRVEQGANLRKLNFRKATIIESRFDGVDLSDSNFGPMTVLARVRFASCNLANVAGVGVRWSDQKSSDQPGGLRVVSPIFSDCEFAGADFKYATFSWGLFENMKYGGSTEPRPREGEMKLDFSIFAVCDLRNVTLHASLRRATFVDCEMDGVRFVANTARNATFNRCSLVGADFSGCDLGGVIFADCDLLDAKFGPYVTEWESIPTSLKGADLRRARNVPEADLLQAERDGALLPTGFGLDFLASPEDDRSISES